MRGVLAAGGSHEVDWSIERILATADKAVGVDVLTRLHSEWGRKPVAPDLDQLWRDLGLRNKGGSLEFDAGAPLAAIREAITARCAKWGEGRSSTSVIDDIGALVKTQPPSRWLTW
jgi:hypothetical protein